MTGLPFTLRQLELFQLLCRFRSFRRTSEDLGISQASVSNQLKALEKQLGVRLLNRESGKKPQLTPPGAAFLADLQVFWEAAQVLAAHRRAIPQGPEEEPSQFRVLIGNYLFKDYVRPKLARFFETHPSVQFEFSSPTIREEARDMLDKGDYDLALFQENIDAPMPSGTRVLARVRCGVFGHRRFVKNRNSSLSAEEVSALPFILPPAGTHYENAILSMLADRGIKPHTIVGRTNFFDVMSEVFDRGSSVGVSIEPLLDRTMHRNAVLLYRLKDWRLTFFRPVERNTPQLDVAENFLIGAVLDDPNYPALVESDFEPAPDTRH